MRLVLVQLQPMSPFAAIVEAKMVMRPRGSDYRPVDDASHILFSGSDSRQPLSVILVFLSAVFETFSALLDVFAGAFHGVTAGHECNRQRDSNYPQVHDDLLRVERMGCMLHVASGVPDAPTGQPGWKGSVGAGLQMKSCWRRGAPYFKLAIRCNSYMAAASGEWHSRTAPHLPLGLPGYSRWECRL